jgi:hypothetical protein
MSERYPGYDVLRKRSSPSWNEQTRRVVDQRLSMDPHARRFLDDLEWLNAQALCARIVPQPPDRGRPAPVAAMLDEKLQKNARDGFRHAEMPPLREAWRRGLAGIERLARQRAQRAFHALDPSEQDALLLDMQRGALDSASFDGMRPSQFFKDRVLTDIVSLYYADPHAWNEIGFGGPASPRGYVRMGFDRRDPWEAAEAKPGDEGKAGRENERV